jgi:peptidoglycan/LPS O-acetylase OafA/YrhL
MLQYKHVSTVIVVFLLFFVLFYVLPFEAAADNTVFLTVSTFLFAIFAGFFISRQSSRYTEIRDKLTTFYGIISFVFRNMLHFDEALQKDMQRVIERFYTTVAEHPEWDYVITHKVTIVTDIHQALEKFVGDRSLATLENVVLNRTMAALFEAQVVRKKIIALREERIPAFQWLIIYILTVVLLVTLAVVLPSQFFVIGAALKAAFAATVMVVVMLLHQFDQLRLFETTVGKSAVQDIKDIINGTK